MRYALLLLLLAQAFGQTTISGNVTITGVISLAVTCGPPNYNCSTAVTSNPGTITSYFTSSSLQNATAYDPTLNPANDCILLATTTASNFGGDSMTGSMSGGANGHDWAWDESMVALSNQGAGVSIYGVTTNGAGCPQITNPGVPAWHGLSSPVAFDWYTAAGKANHDVYELVSHHIIKKSSVADLAVLGTFNTVFDFTAANACPGPIPSPVQGGSIFAPVSDGNGGLQFAQAISPGNQGTATTVLVYSTTKGCTNVDLQNGLYYPWCITSGTGGTNCSSEAGIALSTSGNYCYGFSSLADAIHDGQPSGDGTVIRLSVISGGNAMTNGVCAGITTGGTVAWTIGTSTTTYTNGDITGGATCPVTVQCQYDGHPSEGYAKAFGSGAGLGFNIRNVSNYAGAYTIVAPQLQSFASNGVPNDNHGAWPPGGNFNDAFPMWVGATDLIVTTTPSPCNPTSAVYCPPYLANVLFALPIDGSNANPRLFVHTHSCNQSGASFWQCTDGPDSYFNAQQAIVSVSPQGNFASFASSDLHSFGVDGHGKFRSNILIVRLQ